MFSQQFAISYVENDVTYRCRCNIKKDLSSKVKVEKQAQLFDVSRKDTLKQHSEVGSFSNC